MGFAITKAEPVTEPVSLADAKTHLSVAHDGDDAWISERISAARQAVEQHTSRVFASCTVTEKLDDFPRWTSAVIREPSDVYMQSAIRLSLPAASITSVKYYATTGTETTLTANTDYLTALDRVPSIVYPAPGKVWPSAVQYGRLQAVSVEYTAAVDSRVKLARAAMLLILAHWYEQRSGDDREIPPGALRIMNGLMRPMYI